MKSNEKPENAAPFQPIENADAETISLSTHPKFLAIIELSRARYKQEGGISSDEVRRSLGLSDS